MRLLLVNWQDIENPQGGGAEIHLHEIFGRLAKRGHEVTLLCGGWAGCEPRVKIDGIDVHRVGTRQTFALRVVQYYRRVLARERFDVMIEDINKVPLYSPLWSRHRVVGLVPHLFGATAFQALPAPLAACVWIAERPLSLIYHKVSFQAISESTRDDLADRGIARDRVAVIYPGIDAAGHTPDASVRAKQPSFAYLGRLKKYKGVQYVIRAFGAMASRDAVLEIAGAGDYRPELEQLAASLDLGSRVRFLGRVSEPEKLALLRRSWGLVFASPKEGWGITNLEAAACATPVVASNSPGIRESIRDGETGYLVPHGDVAAMAKALDRLAESRQLVDRIGQQARRFAETFTWERAAEQTEQHLQRVIEGRA